MDFTQPFRGSVAVADGQVTPTMLRGPRFRRLFPDVYVASEVEVDLALRSVAAYLLVEGRGALGGYSAAELLAASCGPADAPAEVVTPIHRRARADLLVRREQLSPELICRTRGVVVTSPLLTAYHLACRGDVVEAVVAVDALTHKFGFPPRDVVRLGYDRFGGRGSARLPEVARLADPLADSPMETRIRLAIRFAGLPLPVLQHPVGPYTLDMAYPEIMLGVEYDGRDHLTQERAMRDLERQAYLTGVGWKILRFRKAEVLHRPGAVAARVRWELGTRVHDRCRAHISGAAGAPTCR